MKRIPTYENFLKESSSADIVSSVNRIGNPGTQQSFATQINEGAKIIPKELSREGEEFIKWFEKTMSSRSVKSIVLKDNTVEVTFNQNLDISEDLFNMVREWPNAPAYMDLYVDVMSVNRGQLVMMIYGKSGMSFTL